MESGDDLSKYIAQNIVHIWAGDKGNSWAISLCSLKFSLQSSIVCQIKAVGHWAALILEPLKGRLVIITICDSGSMAYPIREANCRMVNLLLSEQSSADSFAT